MTENQTVRKKISLDNIDVIVFDFDGVLTNNLVYLDQHGTESVTCSRADGLAFEALRILKKPTYIMSTEVNPVVKARAIKLQVPILQGLKNKALTLKSLAKEKKYKMEKVLYIGNDLNDYTAIKLCGFSACPSDSHPKIKDIVDVVLESSGGMGVARELLEEVMSINLIKLLYNK
jgi:3-deoxy-D-manno-octulosonate 8-phosphate phosphatase (KDO 8-P phosphatase)